MSPRKFTKLFHEHADGLYRFAFFRVSSKELAEDIVSTVFAKAWEKRDTFDGKNAQAWLYTIARNTIIDSYRVRKPERIEDENDIATEDSTETRIDAEIDANKLMLAMENLDEPLREVIHWRYMERVPVRLVAERMGLSEANVRVIQHRALKKLRKWYEKV